eukprot:scaffold1590_cov239-Pinguiococcus_pyrenoidosus.AAC.18
MGTARHWLADRGCDKQGLPRVAIGISYAGFLWLGRNACCSQNPARRLRESDDGNSRTFHVRRRGTEGSS